MLHIVGLLKEVLQTLQQLWEVGRLLISCSDLFLLSLLTHLGMHLMHSCGLQPHLQPRGNAAPVLCPLALLEYMEEKKPFVRRRLPFCLEVHCCMHTGCCGESAL